MKWIIQSEDCGDVVWYELFHGRRPTGLTMEFTDENESLLEKIAAALNLADAVEQLIKGGK